MGVLYECNRTKCGEKCTYPFCMHTSDITHASNFKPSGISDDYIERGWTPIKTGCQMPDEGEEVLVTLWIDRRGANTGIEYAVDVAIYSGNQYYIPDATGKSGFVTINDWMEGCPVIAVAWKDKPFPYISSKGEKEHYQKIWEEFKHA